MSNAPVSAISSLEPLAGGVSFGSVSPGDLNQFLSAMDRPAGTDRASRTQSASEAASSAIQKVLKPLSEFRKGYDKIVTDISDIVSRGHVSMQDLFQIQFQLTQLSYMNDVSAKTADKISQGTQTLFRNQG
ncbi:MAG: hypothetical protein LBB14_03150 [Puniceicoccales bacterium]|jgi:hypothetical protein|nr:hypothetical protein [Puniceicoccales bacterium]